MDISRKLLPIGHLVPQAVFFGTWRTLAPSAPRTSAYRRLIAHVDYFRMAENRKRTAWYSSHRALYVNLADLDSVAGVQHKYDVSPTVLATLRPL
jgi:hypothetical protein